MIAVTYHFGQEIGSENEWSYMHGASSLTIMKHLVQIKEREKKRGKMSTPETGGNELVGGKLRILLKENVHLWKSVYVLWLKLNCEQFCKHSA